MAAADAGARELVAGATTLAAGVDGAHRYANGVLEGATTLSTTLRAGVSADVQKLAHPDTQTLLTGVATSAPGNARTLAAGLQGLLAAHPDDVQLQQLATLAAGVEKQVGALAAPAAAAPGLAQGLIGAADGSARVTAGVGALINGDPSKGWPGTVVLVSPKGAPALVAGAQTLQDGTSRLAAGAADLSSGLQTLSTGASSLYSGTAELSAGAARLDDGAGSLATGVGALQSGAGDLRSGMSELRTGADAVAEGSGALASGGARLDAGAADLAAGNGRIADGSGTLATATAGAAPSLLPWILGIGLVGLIAIGFWIGHRVAHR